MVDIYPAPVTLTSNSVLSLQMFHPVSDCANPSTLPSLEIVPNLEVCGKADLQCLRLGSINLGI